ncbi:MAG: carboxypeptidase-like regulatory domain-containing protein [Candidatus Thermoplasmatota archaeon]|nr:carboxypeptidase-like regulatory domain-containing protein [Candidatus Thermoplasmatota archaeon]
MSEDDADDATYLDEVVEETPVLFASSEAVLTIEDPNLHPMGKATAIFLLFTCLLGFLNGLDYASPEEGLVRPDEFVYRLALTAPDDTATFRGSVVDDEGQPMVNATVYLSWLDDATDVWVSEENLTDDAGAFSFEKLDPGLIRVDIIVERDDHRDVFSNRVLLSPPALIEPIGFTTIDFTFPSSDTFAAQPCEREVGECEIRTVDRTPSQMDHPLMDPTAATGYVLVGFGFMGVALIAAGFAAWALKSGSIVLLRTSSVLAFFTMGHYWSACIFGLLAFILTFAIPRRRVPLLQP